MRLPFQVLRAASTKFCDLREEKMTEPKFVDYYRCPLDGAEWTDIWDCCCNDMCPRCGQKDIEPYESLELAETH